MHTRTKYAIVSAALLLAMLFAALVSVSSFAANDSESSDLPIAVYPASVTERFAVFNAPHAVAVDDNFLAVGDTDGIKVYERAGYTRIAQIQSHPDKMALIGDTLYVFVSGEAYSLYAYDVSLEGAGVRRTIAGGVADIFSDDAHLYYKDASNDIYKYDGIAAEKLDIDKLKYVDNAILRADAGAIYSLKNRVITDVGTGAVLFESVSPVKDYRILSGSLITLSEDGKKVASGNKNIMSDYGFGLSVSGGSIYVADAGDKSVRAFDKDLAALYKIGGTGTENDRMIAPSGMAADDDRLIIADKGAKRVTIYDAADKTYTVHNLEFKPQTAHFYKDGFIAYGEDTLYISDGLTQPVTRGLTRDLLDIAVYGDAIIGLQADGKAINLLTDAVLKDSDKNDIQLHGANKLYINSGTNILYLASPTELKRCNMADMTHETYAHTETSYKEFFVDYGGNIYFMQGENITKYLTENRRLIKSGSFEMKGLENEFTSYRAAITANGDLYIASDIARLTVLSGETLGIVSDRAYAAPDESKWNLVRGISLSADTELFSAPDNYETLINPAPGARFLALAEIKEKDVEYYYGYSYDNGSFYYIKKEQSELLPRTEYPDDYDRYNALLAVGVDVFFYPFNGAEKMLRLEFSEAFSLVHNIADVSGAGWGWYNIRFVKDGVSARGYVRAADIARVSAVQPGPRADYLKVNSGAVGAKVNLYSDGRKDSEVLLTVEDGASVVAVDGYDKNAAFTRVYYNGVYGYIETGYLLPDGLTQVQITAIIVVTVCVAALIVTVPLFVMLYKRSKSVVRT